MAEGLAHANEALQRGNSDEAEVILHEVLEFAPNEARAWHSMGKLRQQQGKHQEALDCFEKASRLYEHGAENSNKPQGKLPISRKLAKLLWQQGEKDAALAMLAVLMIRHPDDEALQAMKDSWEDEL